MQQVQKEVEAALVADIAAGIATGGGLDLQVGANSNQTMLIVSNNMSAENLGVADIDITIPSTNKGEASAISIIDKAIHKISKERGNLGAIQNRLEYTIANLNNSSENLQAAESHVRDTDMAKEIMSLTSKNVLGQATQSMLAQANKNPNNVLSLLQ